MCKGTNTLDPCFAHALGTWNAADNRRGSAALVCAANMPGQMALARPILYFGDLVTILAFDCPVQVL